MRYLSSIFTAFFLSIGAFAQKTIADLPVEKTLYLNDTRGLVLGWKGGYSDPTKNVPGKVYNGRNYSATQLNNSRQFIHWMQASYTPTGCLGLSKYYQNRGVDRYLGTGSDMFYFEKDIPHLYGAYSFMFGPVRKKADGSFYEYANIADKESWFIGANQLEHITTAVNCISSPGESFFIMPAYSPGKLDKSRFPFAREASERLNFALHPNLKAFNHFVIPADESNARGKGLYVVMITKDNKPLPFETITIGEFLDKLRKNIQAMYNVYYEQRKAPSDALEKATQNVNLMIENYKPRLAEEAKINFAAAVDFLTIYNSDKGKLVILEDNKSMQSYPVMRLKKGVAEACKTDTPQWIAIYWSMISFNEDASLHMMKSILENFNFRYVHDYFYADKKPGPYKPLNIPETFRVKN